MVLLRFYGRNRWSDDLLEVCSLLAVNFYGLCFAVHLLLFPFQNAGWLTIEKAHQGTWIHCE